MTTNPSPDISIVIVNYNTKDYTAQCLDSLYANPPHSSFEVIVVDNASADGSADWLEATYPQVRLVRSPRNVGIAGGNNLGIRAGSGTYVLLLNNDTIVEPGSIDELTRFLYLHPEAGGVAGQLLNPDGTFQSGYAAFPSLPQLFLITTTIGRLLDTDYPTYSTAEPSVDWPSTACMMFRREALESVSLVDEDFFIYSDEVDLQYRLRQSGWRHYLAEAKTIHFGGETYAVASSKKWSTEAICFSSRSTMACGKLIRLASYLCLCLYHKACLLDTRLSAA
ncbi:MAG: glycosyltransferase family 2 protein [Anaerolineae bacterium]